MEKNRLMNSGSNKFSKKLSIETKNTAPQRSKVPPQTVKNSIKATAANISSYRILQYVI